MPTIYPRQCNIFIFVGTVDGSIRRGPYYLHLYALFVLVIWIFNFSIRNQLVIKMIRFILASMNEVVIVVDDSPSTLEVVCRIVEKFGFYPIKCNGALEAFQAANQHPRCILLSDYCMPQINGIECLKIIRRKNASIPCVFLTGDSYLIDRVEASSLGVVAILEKPVLARDLKTSLVKAREQLLFAA